MGFKPLMFFVLPMFYPILYALKVVVLNPVESTMKSDSNPATGNADKKINLCKIGVISGLLKSFEGALKCGTCSICPFSVAFWKRLYARRLDN